MVQKYEIGEYVTASGWVGEDTGTIVDTQWIYHNRLGEHCWGYKIKFEGDGPGLNFNYIPEGYLRKHIKYSRKKKLNNILNRMIT